MKSGAFTNSIPASKNGKTASGEQWEDLILTLARYSLNNLKKYAGTHMKSNGGRLLVLYSRGLEHRYSHFTFRLSRIMGAYTDDSIFSIDLTGAVSPVV